LLREAACGFNDAPGFVQYRATAGVSALRSRLRALFRRNAS